MRKESLLDHVYVSNSATISNANFETPAFADHLLVLVNLNLKINDEVEILPKRDWYGYSASKMWRDSTEVKTADIGLKSPGFKSRRRND